MSRIFLSFLGTSPYETCNYYLDNKEQTIETPYVQTAITQFLCANWQAEDKIVIFTTQKAFEKNWQSSDSKQGLEQELKSVNLPCNIKNIMISDGKDTTEIWEIFQKLCDEVRDNDHIIFDITHAFRFLPMLTIIAFIYLKTLKKIEITGVYYGAFEALGTPNEVKNMPVSERLVPIFDLTSFVYLADWSIAVDRFVMAGNSQAISELVKQEAMPLIIEHKIAKNETFAQAQLLQNISKHLNDFTQNISVCRALNITESAKKLKQDIEAYKEQANNTMIVPFIPLLNKIERIIVEFDDLDEIKNGIAAVKWCIEHNLIQQAYTILLEILITFVIASLKDNKIPSIFKRPLKNNIKIRSLVTSEAGSLSQKTEWNYNQQDKQAADLIKDFFRDKEELVTLIDKISQMRNNLNHAGYNNAGYNFDSFKSNITELYDFVVHIVANQNA